jgi:hypothetical protein
VIVWANTGDPAIIMTPIRNVNTWEARMGHYTPVLQKTINAGSAFR